MICDYRKKKARRVKRRLFEIDEKIEKCDLCHSIFSLENFNGIDVFFLCVGIALAFDGVPGVPLCFAREVHHARSRSIAVADGCLLILV